VPERYARRHPEQTPLYRIGTRHLEIWLAERSLGEHPVAVRVEEELRSYLRCGILSFGSALNRLDQSRRSHDNSRIAWAKLLARIAEAFPLECPVCGGDIRLIAFVLLSRQFSTPICPGRFGV